MPRQAHRLARRWWPEWQRRHVPRDKPAQGWIVQGHIEAKAGRGNKARGVVGHDLDVEASQGHVGAHGQGIVAAPEQAVGRVAMPAPFRPHLDGPFVDAAHLHVVERRGQQTHPLGPLLAAHRAHEVDLCGAKIV